MNMLDKLFSREIKRRTGAHAINIYISSNSNQRKRSRSIGKKTLDVTKITTKNRQGSLLHRLDVRVPWLKLVAVVVIGTIIVLDLLDLTISHTSDSVSPIKIAPMSHHAKVTTRTLEGKKLVALTFDDGPSPTTTPRLLDLLTEKDAPATFFMLGMMAQRYPDIVQRAAKDHHEIASHTMYHQNLTNLPIASAQSDIAEANTTFIQILGHGPAYNRPPYGNFNDVVTSSVNSPIILWSVDPRDWQNQDVNTIINIAMDQVHDGAIILMHDIYPTSVDAVPTLIDALRNSGYEFATISELVTKRGITLSVGGVYYDFRP